MRVGLKFPLETRSIEYIPSGSAVHISQTNSDNATDKLLAIIHYSISSTVFARARHCFNRYIDRVTDFNIRTRGRAKIIMCAQVSKFFTNSAGVCLFLFCRASSFILGFTLLTIVDEIAREIVICLYANVRVFCMFSWECRLLLYIYVCSA